MKTKRKIISWLVFAFVVGLMACAGGLIFLKALPEADAARIMSKLPGPVRQVVDSILFPHPAQVPTPSGIKVADLGSLLTPIADGRLLIADSTSTPVPAITPSRIPAISPSPLPSVTPTSAAIAIPSICRLPSIVRKASVG